MVRTVFAEVKMNIPFKLPPKVVQLMKLNSAEMGNHHTDINAAKRMLQSISKHMHMLLLTHLTAEESGLISFILDTTDLRGNDYLITYIRALEEDKDQENGQLLLVWPVVYFYKLLKLAQSEDANAMLSKIVEQIKNDSNDVKQFEKSFKKKLVGFGSDGASVMQGKNNGLAKKLSNYIGNPIYSIHCMAHRLQLAAGHAFESLPISTKFEEMISGLYSFYNNKGHKRKGHLKETAAALEVTYYELTALFKIRWISSEFAAVHKIYKSYGVLVTDLNSILSEDWPDALTKAQAQGLLRLLTDKNLIEFMHFIMDILNTHSYLSQKLQERYGTVIGIPALL